MNDRDDGAADPQKRIIYAWVPDAYDLDFICEGVQTSSRGELVLTERASCDALIFIDGIEARCHTKDTITAAKQGKFASVFAMLMPGAVRPSQSTPREADPEVDPDEIDTGLAELA